LNEFLSKLSRVVAATVLLLFCVSSHAAELREVSVGQEENRYQLKSTTWFDVSPQALYDVLTDYELFSRFTSAIAESRNVEADDEGRPQFYARMEGCVLVWCRSFVRNGYLLLEPLKEIVAISDPERSDFKLSRERWQLVPEGEGVLMIYEFEMIPDFWVPPIVGPYFIKRALRSGGDTAVNRIEALAKGEEPVP